MKKLLFSFVLACSVAGVQANNNIHLHPSASNAQQGAVSEKALSPGYCQIELVNNSFDAVNVYGTFDDGTSMQPFTFYPGSYNQYISLYYASPGQPAYCHAGMYISIFRTSDNYPLYNRYTDVQSTLYITPYLKRGQSELSVTVK